MRMSESTRTTTRSETRSTMPPSKRALRATEEGRRDFSDLKTPPGAIDLARGRSNRALPAASAGVFYAMKTLREVRHIGGPGLALDELAKIGHRVEHDLPDRDEVMNTPRIHSLRAAHPCSPHVIHRASSFEVAGCVRCTAPWTFAMNLTRSRTVIVSSYRTRMG